MNKIYIKKISAYQQLLRNNKFKVFHKIFAKNNNNLCSCYNIIIFMSNKDSLPVVKDYRIMRIHKLPKFKFDQFVKNSSREHKEDQQSFRIKSSCIIIQKQQKKFHADCTDNKLSIYDKSTYAECQYNNIFTQINKKLIWNNILQEISLKKNFILLYIESSQIQNNIFTNDLMINNILKSQSKQKKQVPKTNQDDFGIVEKSVHHMMGIIKRQNNQQLLISVTGFCNNTIIDLLNFQQDFNQKYEMKLKIKKENKYTTVQNLSQIAIDNMQAFYNICLLSNYIKEMYYQKTGSKIQVLVYQLLVGKLSNEKVRIEGIKTKLNFIRIQKNETNMLSSLGNCFREVLGSNQKVLSNRNSKLTHFIEDSLTKSSSINVISEIDTNQSLKSQLNILNFNNFLNNKVILRKNYVGNQNILEKLKKYGNENILLDFTIEQNREKNLELLKKQKYHISYRTRVNRSLLTDTFSSIHKRININSQNFEDNQKSIYNNAPETARDKQTQLRKLYKQV